MNTNTKVMGTPLQNWGVLQRNEEQLGTHVLKTFNVANKVTNTVNISLCI